MRSGHIDQCRDKGLRCNGADVGDSNAIDCRYPALAIDLVGHNVGHIQPERRKDLASFDTKSLIHLVRLAGIEPTTPWFVAKYSIQLSYSRAHSKL